MLLASWWTREGTGLGVVTVQLLESEKGLPAMGLTSSLVQVVLLPKLAAGGPGCVSRHRLTLSRMGMSEALSTNGFSRSMRGSFPVPSRPARRCAEHVRCRGVWPSPGGSPDPAVWIKVGVE